jgi:putative spermidine/putrescine transport system ATP-binding protein
MLSQSNSSVDYLRVAGISKSYSGQSVIEALDFNVNRGELVSLLGPSGCGKTTLLRLIAGLVNADTGSITLGDRELAKIPAHKRNVSVVFQSYALFPHLNVADNVAFGLKARGQSAQATKTSVTEVLELVRMSDFALRPVTQLSGGQQQRVAVARALAVNPDLLLLDEPFSALDRKLRETMQIELRSLLRSRGMTAIFVTHDQDEALAVSDRIAVMNAGKIEHFADPSTLYARPASAFALEFVGLSTRISGTVKEAANGMLEIATDYGLIQAKGNFRPNSKVVIGVRPERIQVNSISTSQPSQDGFNRLKAVLKDIVPLGARTHLYGQATGNDRILCERTGTEGVSTLKEGMQACWQWPVEDTLVYPAQD